MDVVNFSRSGNKLHPTEKPVDLMTEIVKWTDGTVLDPFMGSGSTGIACLNLGRKFIGVEINPEYFNIACNRLEEAILGKENTDEHSTSTEAGRLY